MDKHAAGVLISIVIPAYNEEAVIRESYNRLKQVMDAQGEDYELVFVNDGSRDKTMDILKELAAADPRVRAIGFSRNFGHQVAVSAGLDYAKGDAVVIIDGDLQDPPEVIPEMIAKWREGYDVVYGKRKKREGESLFKKLTAFLYYRILRSMTGQPIPLDTGDFRLMDRSVVEVIKAMPEKNRFLRGMVSWVGFRQAPVEFVRAERFAGESKYPLKAMLKLAGDGITSFSVKPIKMATGFGIFLSVCAFVYLVVSLCLVLIAGTMDSWNIAVAALLLLNGLIFIVLGMMGTYIGRIYEEAKGRPLYIVRDFIGFDEGE
ncbi:MAG: glycosyltransferase family 2 protein [Bacillota bacterium]